MDITLTSSIEAGDRIIFNTEDGTIRIAGGHNRIEKGQTTQFINLSRTDYEQYIGKLLNLDGMWAAARIVSFAVGLSGEVMDVSEECDKDHIKIFQFI